MALSGNDLDLVPLAGANGGAAGRDSFQLPLFPAKDN